MKALLVAAWFALLASGSAEAQTVLWTYNPTPLLDIVYMGTGDMVADATGGAALIISHENAEDVFSTFSQEFVWLDRKGKVKIKEALPHGVGFQLFKVSPTTVILRTPTLLRKYTLKKGKIVSTDTPLGADDYFPDQHREREDEVWVPGFAESDPNGFFVLKRSAATNWSVSEIRRYKN